LIFLSTGNKANKTVVSKKWIYYFEARQAKLKKMTLLFSVLSLLIAIIALYLLLSAFGGLEGVTINYANLRLKIANPDLDFGFEYAKNPWVYVGGLGIIYASAAVSSLYLAAFNRRYLPAYFPILAIIIFSLATGGRSAILQVIIMYSAGFVVGQKITEKKYNWRFLLLPLFLGIAVILVISSFLGKFGEESDIAIVKINPIIAHFYYRATIPFVNLDDYIINHGPDYLMGEATFNPVFRTLYEFGLRDNYTRITNRDVNPITGWYAVATYSYLKWPFDDIGIMGPMILSIMFVAFATVFYMNIKTQASLGSVLMYILLIPTILLSFGSWYLQDLEYSFAILGVILIHLLCKWRTSVLEGKIYRIKSSFKNAPYVRP